MKSVTYHSLSLYANIWDIETPIKSKPAAVKIREPWTLKYFLNISVLQGKSQSKLGVKKLNCKQQRYLVCSFVICLTASSELANTLNQQPWNISGVHILISWQEQWILRKILH